MKTLTETQLDSIIAGAALPTFFDQFRDANGKIFIHKGTMEGDTFVPDPWSSGGNINKRGDSTEGLTALLTLQKNNGSTHVALGSNGDVFAIDDLLAMVA